MPRVLLAVALAAVALAARAQTEAAPPAPAAPHEPLFVGYGTEPGMDFAGRTVASVDDQIARAFSAIGDVGRTHPGVQPAWEFPLGAALLLAQHEVGGHGGRARELGLGPTYRFAADFSGATSIDHPPRTNQQGTLLAAGGVEADGVLAHGVLLDLLRPAGADGAKLPIALMTKLDLTLYVASAKRPTGEDFVRQYRDGNDIAYWLVSRQSARRGGDPAAVWNGDYVPDTTDRDLERTWRAARTTAIWNALDPALVAGMVAYFRQHVLGGEVRVHAPLLRVSDQLGLTVGTRGALGPGEVTRFLDLYAVAGEVVVDAYARDLEALGDKTYGAGLAVRSVALGSALRLAAGADTWREPRAPEGSERRSGWNAQIELQARCGGRLGFTAELGRKSDGFFPGLPLDGGSYVGFGLAAAW